jgi:hypothetical protein
MLVMPLSKEMNPQKLPLKSFISTNVAHSNVERGLHTYPPFGKCIYYHYKLSYYSLVHILNSTKAEILHWGKGYFLTIEEFRQILIRPIFDSRTPLSLGCHCGTRSCPSARLCRMPQGLECNSTHSQIMARFQGPSFEDCHTRGLVIRAVKVWQLALTAVTPGQPRLSTGPLFKIYLSLQEILPSPCAKPN